MNFNQLRKKHKQFIYEGFEIEEKDGDLVVKFHFVITPNIRFSPKITFPHLKWPASHAKRGEEAKLNNLVFNLGLVEALSYWKATCSPEIIINAGYLDDAQIKWWKDLLIKGLGEFFYQNKIDFTKKDLVEIKCHPERSEGYKLYSSPLVQNDKNLVLVGGGKDSAVTLDAFIKLGKEFNCLLLNPTNAALKISQTAGCKNPIIIKRTIDPKLLELNKKGYLNGHTPFSAYLAFLSTLAAHFYNYSRSAPVTFGYKNIVVSNEASSNEGNVNFHGLEINHQYSKSLEFEEKFRKYCKKYLSTQANYYSFLREFNELEIARQFSGMEKYHSIFRSCNVGSKKGGIWCNQCSKCLFSYLILYPFLGEKLKKIFGPAEGGVNKDLLDDEKLSPLMEELLQFPGKFKPFECVGTKEEIEYAMLLSILKLKGKKLPKLLEKYKKQISILILGMGREGQSTFNFLKKYFTEKKIAITDQKNGENYLEKIKNYDIIIKSPGIPYLPEVVAAKDAGKIISSATSIFFDLFKGKIIGITGTKGKSTTTVLIYEVLKSGGLDVYLTGNIGKPSLELLEQINESSIVVFELSSFQLRDLTKSPHIAVITNLYPEHLDWHKNAKNYFRAKANMMKYQIEKDYLIYTDTASVRKITKDSSAKKISFSKKEEAAKIIGKLFKIPDEKIESAIKNFKSLPHRLEFVAEKNGIKFYNDSLATNPYATIYGLEVLGEGVETLITGGFDRGVSYLPLGPIIANSKIKTLILFPDTGKKIWQAVKNSGKSQESRGKKYSAKSMKEAVKLAFEKTSKGKICLLSPASASFNMFKDYADRGEQFKACVQAL